MKKFILLVLMIIGLSFATRAQTSITVSVNPYDIAASDFTPTGNSLANALHRQFGISTFVYCDPNNLYCIVGGVAYYYDTFVVGLLLEDNLHIYPQPSAGVTLTYAYIVP